MNAVQSGLYRNVPNVPRIEDFSGEVYEKYVFHFPPVESAVYVYNGTELAIEPDDPRLVRLLNFLAYSENKYLSCWTRGYVNESEMNGFLASDDPRLEVSFYEPEPLKLNRGRCTQEDTPKIIICGDNYLLYCRESDPDGTERIERWWPYGSLYEDWAVKRVDRNCRLLYEGWGDSCWIDLLVYAGFTKPSESDISG